MRKGDKMEVKISASIKYGNYKQYLKGAQMQVDLYKKVLPLAKKIMKLPKSVSLEVRPIKGRTQGLYFKRIWITIHANIYNASIWTDFTWVYYW